MLFREIAVKYGVPILMSKKATSACMAEVISPYLPYLVLPQPAQSICTKPRSYANAVPCPILTYKVYEDLSSFKLYMGDVGLLVAKSGLSLQTILLGEANTFMGAVTRPDLDRLLRRSVLRHIRHIVSQNLMLHIRHQYQLSYRICRESSRRGSQQAAVFFSGGESEEPVPVPAGF